MAFTSASIASVGNVPYYIPTTKLALPPTSRRLVFGTSPDLEDGLVPVSVVVFPDGSDVSAGALSTIVDSYLQGDDVFSRSFLEHIYLLTDRQSEPLKLDHSYSTILEDWGTQSVHVVRADANESPRGGPYFASNKGLRQAWRLFGDTNGAFIFPLVPIEANSDT
jgi:hypothetical protein